jgi:hypothetical protein
MTDSPDLRLWAALRDQENRMFVARRDFLVNTTDRVGVLRAALDDPGQRGTALRLLPHLREDEVRQLFDPLVRLCSVGHGDIVACRAAIRALPRDWVVDRIEASAEPVLAAGDDEEYRRLLELYDDLDPGLTQRLAVRAAAHDDPHVREAGRDFLERYQP